MNSEAYTYILIASIAGGIAGVLVMWNRKRSQVAGASRLRGFIVLAVGTVASGCALLAFAKAFGAGSPGYSVIATIMVTGWVAVLQTVAPLPVPPFIFRARKTEAAVYRVRWTGVRLFGAFLRRTPLRHLGGQVYLSSANRDPQTVLRGIRDAEAVHLWALVFCCPLLVFWGLEGWWRSMVWSAAVHLPLNIYPVLHLRHVTGRVEAYVAKCEKRKGYQFQRTANSQDAAR